MMGKQSTQPISVSCQGLSYSIEGKSLLHHINLVAEPGELLALVGPSGAGKSTLLNNLAFRITKGTRKGKILLNGHETMAKTFRAVCNYVMVDGRMLPYLTVYETLLTAAKLKLPGISDKERIQRVEVVMSELGLTSCRDTYIGGEWKKGISTGTYSISAGLLKGYVYICAL